MPKIARYTITVYLDGELEEDDILDIGIPARNQAARTIIRALESFYGRGYSIDAEVMTVELLDT